MSSCSRTAAVLHGHGPPPASGNVLVIARGMFQCPSRLSSRQDSAAQKAHVGTTAPYALCAASWGPRQLEEQQSAPKPGSVSDRSFALLGNASAENVRRPFSIWLYSHTVTSICQFNFLFLFSPT